MNRAVMRANIALHLGTTEGGALSTDELNRAISQAVSEMSRYVPNMLHEEIHFELDVSSESFTSNHNTEVALANGEIQKDSETVTNAGATVTYDRDTDYEMDYINGRINVLSTGDMANSTAHKITYKRSQTILSTTGLLTTPISIIAIEYPIDQIPMSWCAFEWHGNSLVVRTRGQRTQSAFTDEDEIRIWYTSEWDDPTNSASGSYPRFLDEMLVLGASGYALQMEARTQEHATIADLAGARTTLEAADDDQGAIDTALGLAVTAFGLMGAEMRKVEGSSSEPFDLALAAMALSRTQLALSNTALDDMNTHKATAITAATAAIAELVIANAEFDLANAEFDKVNTHLATTAVGHITEMDDYMTGGTNGAKIPLDLIQAEMDLANAALDKVTTHAGTEADTALDKVNVHITTDAETALDAVGSHLHAASDSAKKALDDADGTPYADINTALDAAIAELGSATRNADDFLNSGDGLINTVNTGLEPAGEFRRYAETKIGIARTRIEEALARVSEMGSLTDIAQQRIAMAGTFVAEASQRMAMSEGFVSEAGGRIGMATAFVNEAAGRVAMIQAYVGEASARLGIADAFGSQADRQILIAQSFIESGNGYMQNAMGYIQNAMGYIAEANVRLGVAQGLADEASGRQSEAQVYVNEAGMQVQVGQLLLSVANGYLNEGEGHLSGVDRRLSMELRYLSMSNGYQQNAVQISATANLMRVEADEILTKFRRQLEDRRQVLSQRSIASVIQWSQ